MAEQLRGNDGKHPDRQATQANGNSIGRGLRSSLHEYRAVILLGAMAFGALTVALWLWLTSQEDETQRLRLAAGAEGGVYLPVAKALAGAFEKHANVQVEVLPTKGAKENLTLLDDGKVDLALLQNDSPAGSSVRTVAPLYEEYLHLVASSELDANHARELTGQRIALDVQGSGSRRLAESFLPFVGLSPGSYTLRSLGLQEARAALGKEGPQGVDAFVTVLGLPAPAVTHAIREDGAKLVPLAAPSMNGNVVDAFRLEHPWVQPTVIPRGTYATTSRGIHPPEPIGTLSVLSVLACKEELEPQLVNSLCRAMYQHRSALVRAQPRLASIKADFDPDRVQFPLHLGSRQWLEGKGPSFIVQYAETMGFLLSAAFALWAIVSGAARWLDQRKKNRIDEHYDRLHAVLDDLGTLESNLDFSSNVGRQSDAHHSSRAEEIARLIGHLHDLEQRSKEVGRRAFQELVNEQLSANESFVIFQNLLTETQEEIRRTLSEVRMQQSSFQTTSD